jgi:predicted nucleic acid-binding protein
MRAVLVDTGPLYALVDPSDQYHSRAAGELERLTAGGYVLHVAYPNLLEAYTLVLRKLGGNVALGWLAEVRDGFGLLNPNRESYWAAANKVRRYPDQAITLFDAVLAVLAEEVRLPIWTYDHHFDDMEAQVWR